MEKQNNVTLTLSIDTVKQMHKLIAERTGGSPALREAALLESSLASPFQTFGGTELYPTLLEKGVMLGYGLICNHPFVDGNKRIGILAMLTFFKINGCEITATSDDVIQAGLGVASGEMRYDDLYKWARRAIRI